MGTSVKIFWDIIMSLEVFYMNALPWVLVGFFYLRTTLTGEFDYLWNSRNLYEEDIQ